MSTHHGAAALRLTPIAALIGTAFALAPLSAANAPGTAAAARRNAASGFADRAFYAQ